MDRLTVLDADCILVTPIGVAR